VQTSLKHGRKLNATIFCVCAVAFCSHQVKAKFIKRGVEIVAQLYSTDEGLIVDVSRLEV
jgi:hypothetical protein